MCSIKLSLGVPLLMELLRLFLNSSLISRVVDQLVWDVAWKCNSRRFGRKFRIVNNDLNNSGTKNRNFLLIQLEVPLGKLAAGLGRGLFS